MATIGFHCSLETLQARRPEIRQDLLERLEALRIDYIHAPLTVSADVHQQLASQLLTGLLRRSLEPGQYLSIRYTDRLEEAGAVRSVGPRGDSSISGAHF